MITATKTFSESVAGRHGTQQSCLASLKMQQESTKEGTRGPRDITQPFYTMKRMMRTPYRAVGSMR